MKAFPNMNKDIHPDVTKAKDLNGMDLKHYAAIKLKVPNSGIDWLDEMIKESIRNDLAAKAMQGCLSYSAVNPSSGNWQENSTPESLANYCYTIADAMMGARNES